MAFTFPEAVKESLPTGAAVALGYAGAQMTANLTPLQNIFLVGSLATVVTAVGMYLGRN